MLGPASDKMLRRTCSVIWFVNTVLILHVVVLCCCSGCSVPADAETITESAPPPPDWKVTVFDDEGEVNRSFYSQGFSWDVPRITIQQPDDYEAIQAYVFCNGRVVAERLTEAEQQYWVETGEPMPVSHEL